MAERRSIDLKNSELPESGSATPSRPSFYFQNSLLDPNDNKVEFLFINWPGYNVDKLETYTIASSDLMWCRNCRIVLKYIASGKQRVVMHLTHPDGSKNMSLVTYEDYDIIDVIDATINTIYRTNPPGPVFRHYKPLSPEEWDKGESTQHYLTIKWGILKTESLYISNVSLVVHELADVPNIGISYYSII